jgi:hypothetical protein
MFRDLKASEVECRVGMQGASGLTLLLYKDARVDMSILDETVGQENWQCKFYEFKGILFCSLGIRVGGEWIWKDDAGVESNTEAEKGNASDARKRSGFAWGIGRELYTSPFILVKSGITLDEKGKCKDSFSVDEIVIEDKVIKGLAIKNNSTKQIVYTYGNTKAKIQGEASKAKQEPKQQQNEPKNAPQSPQMTYQEALEVTYGTRTLKEIYKTEREHISVVYELGSDKVKQAITIIEAYLTEYKANKK